VTTARLIQVVRLNQDLRSLDIGLDNSEIDLAGSQAQAEILRECEPLEATLALTLVNGQETYTAGDAADINKINRICPPIVYTDGTAQTTIFPRDKAWVDNDRGRVNRGGASPTPPMYYYTILTEPRTIGFWCVPTQGYSVAITYKVRHTTAMNLVDSSSGATPVDPILPDEFERCIMLGTITFILEERSKYVKQSQFFRQLFEAEKVKMRVFRTMSKYDGPRMPQNGLNL